MEALTTLINVDVAMAPKLVSFIANAIDDSEAAGLFLSSCTELIDTAQSEALIRKILDHTENILEYDNPADAEGCFQALVSILFTIQDKQVSLSIVNAMIRSLCANNSHSKLRLQILVTLFNLLTHTKEKYEIAIALLKFGRDNGMSNIVSQLHENIEGWIVAWKLSVEDERVLLKLAVDVLSRSNQELQSRKFLGRFLLTYGAQDFPADVLGVAVAAAVSAVKAPAAATADRAIILEGLSKQHNASVELSSLVGLLRILCSGSLAEYTSYQSQHAAVLTRLGVDEKATHHTMRLMTLCAAVMGRQKVSYSDIAAVLHVDPLEVEEWIVEAIASGLLEGSMDQINGVLTVSRCFHGSFGVEQWRQIHTKLVDWRRSVNSVLSTMKKTKQSGESA